MNGVLVLVRLHGLAFGTEAGMGMAQKFMRE